MGRQKGKHVNTAAKALIKEYPDKFSDNFNDNKVKLNELNALTYSKSEKNQLAGAITQLIKGKKN